MAEATLAQTLFFLATIFLATLLLGTLLVRARILVILSALFVGIHYLPQAALLKKMRTMNNDIVTLTLLNTIIPFIFGMAAMLLFGYGWTIAFVIGVIAFLLFFWIMYRYFYRVFHCLIPHNATSLLILSLMILFIFGVFSEKSEIYMVVGAIFNVKYKGRR